MIRFAPALVVLASTASTVTEARADRAAADRLAAEATAAAASDDFKTAAAKFTAAYKENPADTDVFCNIGISYFKAGELPRAHLLMTLCVQRAALNLAFKDKANAVIASIEEQLRAANHTPVTIKVSPKNAVLAITEYGEVSEFVGTRTIWLPFGTHQLSARLEGYTPRTLPIETRDQQPTAVEITLDKVVIPDPTPIPPTAPPTSPSRRSAPSLILPVAASAFTVAAILVAGVAYAQAHEAAERSPFAIDEEAIDEDEDKVTGWNFVMGASATVAVLGAAASTYLWLRVLRYKEAPLEVTPTAGGAAATFTLRF